MTAPAKKTGTRANSRKRKPPMSSVQKMAEVAKGLPEEFKELPKPADLAKQGPYPATVQTYAYQPKAGGPPILLPLDGFDPPDKVWHFDVAQLPPLTQTWKWMDKAHIPKLIQRELCGLPDAEYFAMFDEWFSVMLQYNKSGGPKGSLTAGK